MKRKIAIGIIAMTAATFTVGCGNNGNETGYVGMNNLNNKITASIEDISLLSKVQAESTGTERTEDRNVLKNANVMNKPDKSASVIGRVTTGEKVKIIGLLENSNWFKVVFNGRVAYIESDSIEKKADDANNTVSETTGNNQGGNTGNTTGGNQQNNSGGNNNKPGNKPNEETTNKPGEKPGQDPTEDPTEKPGENPGEDPTEDPTENPGENPGEDPTEDPTENPGEDPGQEPGGDPGENPGQDPSGNNEEVSTEYYSNPEV